VVPLAMPLEAEVEQASVEHPLLGLGLELDFSLISELLLSMGNIALPIAAKKFGGRALYISQTDPVIQDALIRFLRLLNDPTDLRILGPGIVREICYRLLQGEQAGTLRQLVAQNSSSHQVATMIHYINQNFSDRISVDDLAQLAGMSTSSLHHKFREVTSMSPLQYLKKIRLHKARAIMLEQGLQASEAGYEVGYANPSQFSREFKRMFGLPPGQLVKDVLTADS